ncbi:MAG: hypothetical protein ACMZ7B_08685 [Balneola sp.]
MKKTGIILFISILLTPLLYAQEMDDFAATKQLGLSLSSVTGAGIHYIYPYNERDNLKFVGIYIYNDDNNGKDSFFSLGAEYQRDLRETSTQRIYAFGGFILITAFRKTPFLKVMDNRISFLAWVAVWELISEIVNKGWLSTFTLPINLPRALAMKIKPG